MNDLCKLVSIVSGIVAIGIFMINIPNVFAGGNDTNITGTYDGKGVYKIEDMSVTNTGSDYKFIGYVHNISNGTLNVSDIVVEMVDSNGKLIEFTRLGGGTVINSGQKLPYRVIANDVDPSNFDHYVVRVLGANNSPYKLVDRTNSSTQKNLYNECVRVAGNSTCDFLFKK